MTQRALFELATLSALGLMFLAGLTWSEPVGACTPVECQPFAVALEGGTVTLVSGDPAATAPVFAETGTLYLDAYGAPEEIELDDELLITVGVQ